MRRGGRYRYFAGDGVQAVDLPYAGGQIAMLVVLPATAEGLPALEKALTADEAQAIGSSRHAASEPGDVLLPRFKTTDEFDLAKRCKTWA